MLQPWVEAECANAPQWEDTIPWLYLDSKGNPTTAEGYLVASVQASLLLPWKNPDGSAATASAISDDWRRVTALAANKAAAYYRSPAGLSLALDDIKALTLASVQALDAPLHALYPNFDAFPLSAQTGIADRAYELGIGRPAVGDVEATGLHAYTHFNAACNAAPPQWLTAAQQCYVDKTNPAFNKRNAWAVEQFIQAAKESQ